MNKTETDILRTRVSSLMCELDSVKRDLADTKQDLVDSEDRRTKLLEKYQVDLREMRRIQEERDEAQKACAEMREVIQVAMGICEEMQQVSWLPDSDITSRTFDVLYDKCNASISSDCGRDYIHRDKVKPLVDILQQHHAWHLDGVSVFFEQDGKPIYPKTDLSEAYVESAMCDDTIKALAKAKEAGL